VGVRVPCSRLGAPADPAAPECEAEIRPAETAGASSGSRRVGAASWEVSCRASSALEVKVGLGHRRGVGFRRMIDLDRYLERIGLDGRPSPAAVQRAHTCSIPFESLDPWAGRPVSLELAAIEDKLVTRRQGGYCFEQNLLLRAALQQLGHDVELLLGRVRIGASPGEVRPRTHAALRVWWQDRPWLLDVGFGHGGPLEPLPLQVGGPHVQSGWSFRLIAGADADAIMLQAAHEDGWRDLYELPLKPVPGVDLETANWFTSTHPSSQFVRGPIVCLTRPDGGRVLLRGDGRDAEFLLVELTPTSRDTTPVSPQQLPAVLAQRFGLDPERVPQLPSALSASAR
jgi:N-hydroxyarylamine O-acetyltransferase